MDTDVPHFKPKETDASSVKEDNDSKSKQEGSNNEEDKEDINRSKQEGSNNEEDKEDINRSKQKGSNKEEDKEDISRSAVECTKCKDKLAKKDKEIESLTEEKQKLETSLKNEIETRTEQSKSLREELQAEKRKLDTYHHQLVTLTEEKQKLETSLKNEIETRTEQYKKLQNVKENLAEHKKIINSTLKEQDNLQKELKEKTDEVTRLHYAKRDVEHTIDVYVQDNKRLTLEAADFRNTLTKEKKRIEELIKDIKAAKQEIAQLQRKDTAYKKKLKEAEQNLTNANNETKTAKDDLKRTAAAYKEMLQVAEQKLIRAHNETKTAKDELKRTETAYKKTLQEAEQIRTRLQSDLAIALKDRDDYQVRLSALMSTKLTTNNPEITDLSDINRPTKLAEQWSELYDNEYTELFEALQCDEKEKISLILKLLKRSFDICQEIREQGVDWLSYCSENNTMHNPLPKKEEEGKKEPRPYEGHEYPESASSKGEKNKGTQDCRSKGEAGDDDGQDSASSLEDKNKGGGSQENPDTKSEIDNKEEKQVLHSNEEPRDDGGQDSASSLGDKNKEGGGQENPDTKSELDNKEGTKESRSNGEPGDEGGQDSASSLGDKNEGDESQVNPDPKDGIKDTIDDNQKQTMNRYSQTAMAEMVKLDVPDELKRELMLELSPYLKKKAPEFVDILNKKLPERVAKEFDIAWNTGDALDMYLKSCIRLCWLMGIQSPPVYIRFDEQDQTTRQAKLDKHFYREYTKAGQYIDYVVWPPLLLHNDGPLLQRGVAQGTDSKD